jgi:hypothetical protein
MNERIRELIKQSSGHWNHGDFNMGSSIEFQEDDIQKFFNLIVVECVNVLDPNGEYAKKYKHSHTPGPDGLRQVLSQKQFHEMMAANKLKKHFGVE